MFWTPEGLKCLIKLTSSDSNDTDGTDKFAKSKILASILNCINSSCQLCESNRQFFVENGLCENLMKLFEKHQTDDLILNMASMIIRSLLLDDDIRHAFGKSHEHAKFIASQLNGIDVLLHIGLGKYIFICVFYCCFFIYDFIHVSINFDRLFK